MSGVTLYESKDDGESVIYIGAGIGLLSGLGVGGLIFYTQLAPYIDGSLVNAVGIGALATGGVFGLMTGNAIGTIYHSIKYKNKR